MRSHSRWATTAAAILAVAMASSASDARDRARIPLPPHAPAAIRTPHRLAQVPPPAKVPPAVTQTAPETSQPPSDAPQTPPADVPPEVPVPAAKPMPSAVMLDPGDAQAILGKSVRSSAGEDMGRLVDVLVDRDGQPRAAIIDFGGFLGVGSRKIAVDWSVLKFMRDDKKQNVVTVELTKDQVKAAPEFKEGSAVVILGALGNAQPAPAAANPQDSPQQEK
jgi:hypothetical protein